ncbi:MAG: aromatic ring-hydroxylating dioxygenase subunit alpha [Microcoleaceae cyanobacterium]
MKEQLTIFNNSDCFIEGWYWAIPTKKLGIGKIKAVSLLGKELAIFRNFEKEVIAVDAYCPHMGAHLAEGKIEGEGVRCFFHNWKFNNEGKCIEVPCLNKSLPVNLNIHPTAEKYGIIWVWTGKQSPKYLPFVPELEKAECEIIVANSFIKNCHPNVLTINAIDAHHFNTVHNLPLEINFEKEEINENAIAFNNTTRGGDDSFLIKLIRPFYRNEVTYKICYWYGSTGTVTIGPDFLHFYIMFALRGLEGGKTAGKTILIAKKRFGLLGWLFNRIVLCLTWLVGNYFAKGDTRIFQTIKFNLQTPLPADRAIVDFIKHAEAQQALSWGSWEEVDGDGEILQG